MNLLVEVPWEGGRGCRGPGWATSGGSVSAEPVGEKISDSLDQWTRSICAWLWADGILTQAAIRSRIRASP